MPGPSFRPLRRRGGCKDCGTGPRAAEGAGAIRWHSRHIGDVPRSSRAPRLAASQASALTIAKRLSEHTRVHSVRYPGLPSHPAHTLASTFMRGFSGVVTLEVQGDAARADAVCRSLKIVRHATSLGAVESTIERRAAVPGQEHLPPGLLRMSVGCEDVEDLWRDIERALNESPA